ncbi:uncharacterized protein LOC134778267 [Penaeus indicus]|uniref:uncharacterized protein LOC134778267 n=1 Tax=Penaeus indicus TaxID=29960 RepID=UPI00300CB1F9
MERVKDMRDAVGEALGSCFRGGGHASPSPTSGWAAPQLADLSGLPRRSWDSVRAGVDKLSLPAWGDVKDQLRPDWSSIRRFPTDKLGGWPELPRPDFSSLRRPSVNGLRAEAVVSASERLAVPLASLGPQQELALPETFPLRASVTRRPT